MKIFHDLKKVRPFWDSYPFHPTSGAWEIKQPRILGDTWLPKKRYEAYDMKQNHSLTKTNGGFIGNKQFLKVYSVFTDMIQPSK